MKVLHIISYVSPFYGGPTFVVNQMAKALANNGVIVDVATTSANGNLELDVPIGVPISFGYARYYYFLRSGLKKLMYSKGLHNWIRDNIAKYDLIHIHGVFSVNLLFACFAANNACKPYIISTHGMLDPWCLSHKFWKKYPYFKLFERRNLQNASIIHATSKSESMGLISLGFKSRIRIIPLGVDLQSEVVNHESNSPALRLLFLSRIDPIKGLPNLFKAISLIKEHHTIHLVLNIVGNGDEDYVSDIKNLAKKLNIFNNCRFLGYLEGESKEKIIKNSDIFVLPSYHENFSLATAEAMSFGLPVIVTDQVGIFLDIIREKAGSVVLVDDIPALANAILLYQDKNIRLIAGKNARKLASREYSTERFSAELYSLYQELTHNKLKLGKK